jgi:hypothetical protein
MGVDTDTLCTDPVTTSQPNLTLRISSFDKRYISGAEVLIPIRPCSNEACLVLSLVVVEVV